MNKELINVYLFRKGQEYLKKISSPLYKKKDIEEIIMGDISERDKNRERYLEEELERKLNEIIMK